MGVDGKSSAPPAPPLALVIAADASNIIAGVFLVISFFTIMGAFTFSWFKMEGAVHEIMQVTMCLEGVFWAIAAGCLVKINLITNNAVGVLIQTIICFGGIFFAVSGWGDGTPGNVISIKYILAPDSHVLFADACPYYGITCFMIATSIGLSGVWSLPRNKLVSPFWAVACFWIGAWTIGVISLWGPTLADGLASYDDMADPATGKFDQNTFAQAWIHVFQVIGAIFLTIGGILFAMLDFCPSDAEEVPSDAESDESIE